VQTEEISLFESMKGEYIDETGAKLKRVNVFADAWNAIAAERLEKKIEGDNDVILVHRKSAIQLQEHLTALIAEEGLTARATEQHQELYNLTPPLLFVPPETKCHSPLLHSKCGLLCMRRARWLSVCQPLSILKLLGEP